jgi:TRAP-type mannitol/chloroaromatic compound transport system substrate-binding protein
LFGCGCWGWPPPFGLPGLGWPIPPGIGGIGMPMPSPLIDGWLSSQSCTKLWDELSAEFGFKTLYAGHTNTCATLWSSTPLERLHDLTDRSFNCIGLAADIVQGIGGGQTRRALLDVAAPAEVVVCPTAADALGSGLARSRRFVAHTTLSGYGSALTITFARSTWNRMPIGERTLLSLTVQRLRTSKDSQCRTLIQAADEPILRALAKARQVIVYQLPSEIRSAIENVAAAVIADNAAFDSHSRAINTAYFQHRSQFGHHFSQVGV